MPTTIANRYPLDLPVGGTQQADAGLCASPWPVVCGLDAFPIITVGLDAFPSVAAGTTLVTVPVGIDVYPVAHAYLDMHPDVRAALSKSVR